MSSHYHAKTNGLILAALLAAFLCAWLATRYTLRAQPQQSAPSITAEAPQATCACDQADPQVIAQEEGGTRSHGDHTNER